MPIIIVLTVVFNFQAVFAQEKLNIRQVSNMEHVMVNYIKPTLNLDDLKGKFIILDFWATWCSSCIANFPKLDSLQEKYKGSLNIILVNTRNTNDDKKKVEDFFLKRHNLNGNRYNLPSIVLDTFFKSQFPHRAIPHYVWINPDGTVEAITGSGDVNKQSIENWMRGSKLHVHSKSDVLNFDRNKFLLTDSTNGISEIKFRTTITGHMKGVGGPLIETSSKTFVRRCAINRNILSLYTLAYKVSLPGSRYILEVENPSEWASNDWTDVWIRKNTYCYEVIMPISKKKDLDRIMQDDLNRYFGMTGKFETRKVRCFELVKTSFKAKQLMKESKVTEVEDAYQSIEVLVHVLNRDGSVPTFNSTGITDDQLLVKIDGREISNLQKLKKALNISGFDLVETEKELEMFVISEVEE